MLGSLRQYHFKLVKRATGETRTVVATSSEDACASLFWEVSDCWIRARSCSDFDEYHNLTPKEIN